MKKFACFDLETTSTDVATCEVVQAAVVEAPRWADCSEDASGLDLDESVVSSRSMLFHAASIPEGATAVHGITAEMVADSPPFVRAVRSFVSLLTAPDIVAVSFNGCGYDIPIVARYAAIYSDHPDHEALLREKHIDVMRLWARARKQQRGATWSGRDPRVSLHAECFAGTLTAAHAFWIGEVFDSAHDATVDCLATLRVLDAMLREGFVDVATAIKWSNEPLPGDVDFAGKFKWQGDRCVITIGKQSGSPIEHVDVGFLRWMLGKDFPADTKRVVSDYLAGNYPQRQG